MCYLTDETVQRQHLNQYINIYFHRECRKTSFNCFIVTAENLIWPVVFHFSVHGDWQRNIYLEQCFMRQNQYQFKYMLILNLQGNYKFRNMYQLNVLEKPLIDIVTLQNLFAQKINWKTNSWYISKKQCINQSVTS